jgi:type IV secretory pathway VirD2 relaxase
VLDDPAFRIRPKKPLGESSGGLHPLAKAYLRSVVKGRYRGGKQYRTRGWSQRCTVKFRFHRNQRGKVWAAHGRYISRKSATDKDPGKCAFDEEHKGLGGVAEKLEEWQVAGDKMHWRIVISPEFGADADLEKLTRRIMGQMAEDLGTELQWMAVIHTNKDHPHVHVVLRGVRADGSVLRLAPQYLKQRPRMIAQAELNRQLGLRKPHEQAKSLAWRMKLEMGRRR